MTTTSDRLDEWMHWLNHRLAAAGIACRYEYDDRLLGDVMVIASEGPSGLCELIVTRHRRGHARLAVVADRREAIAALAQATAGIHRQVARRANAKRKLIHRIERVVEEAAQPASWERGERATVGKAATAAMTGLRQLYPGAAWMIGLGLHTAVAGAGDRVKGTFVTVLAAAITIDGRRRGLAYDPQQGAFVIRGAALAQTQRLRGQALTTSAVALAGFGLVLAESGLTDAQLSELAETAAREAAAPPEERSSACDWADACDVFDCVDLPSALIPDCDLSGCDLGGCDLGGCDLSCDL